MFVRIKWLLLAFTLLASQANAAKITLESITIDDAFSATDFSAYFQLFQASASFTELTEFNGVQTGSDKLNRLTIEFDMIYANTIDLFAGLDATYGASVWLNGTQLFKTTDDLWWSNNWNNGDVVSIFDINMGAGLNIIEIYYAENCCNGPNAVRFFNQGTGMNTLTVDNIAANEVPAPATVALMGLGLIALGLRRRIR